MYQIIRAKARYHFENEWLSTYWHFSFDHYYDPANEHFSALRVFNEDWIQPGTGFPMHPHRDMEIVTYVIEGQLTHQDSMGNRGVIGPGEVQRMTAGTGIRHAEFNAGSEGVHLLQMWVLPERHGLAPSWEQRRYGAEARRGRWLPVVSGRRGAGAGGADGAGLAGAGGAEGPLAVHQDTAFYVASLEAGASLAHSLEQAREGPDGPTPSAAPAAVRQHAYLFVIAGAVEAGGHALDRGDQARISGESSLAVTATSPSELILIDLP